MHTGTSWAHKINAYTIITTNCANNCKVLVPPIPTIKQKQSMGLLAVKLKQSYFSSLCLLLIYYLAFVSALWQTPDFTKVWGREMEGGWWQGFMDALNADMLFHCLASPNKTFEKLQSPKLYALEYVFWLYPSLSFLKDKKEKKEETNKTSPVNRDSLLQKVFAPNPFHFRSVKY